eukprot:Blabericola_migrator_1__12215@NODE_75_length_15195_cov_183_882866_g67_i0_p8_GENE_NODE_75_length_15195_cov_183_882866_g67_i0NODE_75_length_15195_cov_183_882866_g67_i0_p8_ORF_typecomplete_len115_score9_93DUF4785/PF16024_5/0_059PAS_4/PF08448_10/0_13PAS_4/PF08448_10/7_8e03ISETFN3_linker/PF16625_5/0_15_NODE_75_length_15195_cov_183_882866_g67_i01456814912
MPVQPTSIPEGEVLPVSRQCADDEGQVRGSIASTVDTTERKHSEEEAALVLPDGRRFPLKILKPTYGDEIILDIQHMFREGKVLFYDPGFNSVASCHSAVTYTDGDKGECRYRG